MMARVPKAHTKRATVHQRRYQTSTIPVSQHLRHKPPSRQDSKSNSPEEGDSESNFEDDADIASGLTDIDVKSDFEIIDPVSDIEDNDLESELGIIMLDSESIIDSGYSSDQELAAYHKKLNPGHVSTLEQAEYLHQRRCHYAQQGPSMANHADRTLAMIETARVYFSEFCLITGYDFQKTLGLCDAAVFKTYIEWRVKWSRIKKLSTVHTYWKVLSMLYAQEVRSKMKDEILFDIRNWLATDLLKSFPLDVSPKEKGCLFVDDLMVYIYWNWVRGTQVYAHERFRGQDPFIWLCKGFTTSRPGAVAAVLYKHVRLWLVRGNGGVPTLTMTLRLEDVKRSAGEVIPKEYTFPEGADLPLCPLIYLLSFAFADQAFEADLCTPEQIYQLRIPPWKPKIAIKWKKEWRDRPICRDVEPTSNGVRISDTKPLDMQKHRANTKGLGRGAGFRKIPEDYDLRRASGKLITEALTAEECNQIMGHRSRSTYTRYYAPPFIDRDVQAIYCGMPSRENLIREVGRQVRDENAPKGLTEAQKAQVKKDPTVVDAGKARDIAKEKIYSLGFKTISDAKEKTEWHLLYIKANAQFNARKSLLREKLLNKTIDEFHERVDTDEINNQLKGIMPDEVLTPPTMHYELEDRALAAELFFRPLHDLNATQVFNLRIDLIKCLTRLNTQRASPRWCQSKPEISTPHLNDSKQSRQKKVENSRQLLDSQVAALQQGGEDILFCGFCRWAAEGQVGPLLRYKKWPRKDNLQKHVRRKHLRGRDKGPIPCPWEGCSAFLGSGAQVQNHIARAHGQYY
ncbi:hypothetical protein B0J14DRAFT_112396 [Halenospora varia]|nr:hypothetical protein B0J14DRAFT_112396 [Halenospora varia]